jgi:hypothetical protein
MNDRIKELMGKTLDSEFSHTWDTMTYEGLLQFSEKFAELIVKECADAADMAQDAGCEYAGDYVAEYMGFGQEQGVTEWRAK